MNPGHLVTLFLLAVTLGLKAFVFPGMPWELALAPVWVPMALAFLITPFLWFVYAVRWEFPNLRAWWCLIAHRRSHHLYWTDFCENHHKCHKCSRLWMTGRKEGKYP